MLFDCAIIGGGPAGLNAALILGRARRNVILLDNNTPRNAVSQESHGFITRDGIKPKEFREKIFLTTMARVYFIAPIVMDMN